MEYEDVVTSESGEEITESSEPMQLLVQESKEEDELSSVHEDKKKIQEQERKKWQEERERDMEYLWGEDSFEYSLNLIEHRLEERRSLQRIGQQWSSSACIFRLPDAFIDINCKAQQPEIVSIGPFHRGKEHLLEFEEHKWLFLDRLLSRPGVFRMDLKQYLRKMRQMEKRARECYSEAIPMSTHDFVEMMLLDSCFVVEILRYIDCHSRSDMISDTGDPIYGRRPWLIPVFVRDLFKLENQLPLFILESFFIASKSPEEYRCPRSFGKLAIEVFGLVSPGLVSPILSDTITFHQDLKAKHLLDLLHSSLLPQNQLMNRKRRDRYHRPAQSIQSVTQLRPSGIKFRSRKSESMLDIRYHNGVLEIPSIAINDFTADVLINCVAWEQCLEDEFKYFSQYVSFMNCLISQPRDVAFLCLDGIISRFSNDDQYVANLFNNLSNYKVFNSRDCYLYKQFKEIEAYYCSNWATLRRTYFSSPWSFILLFSAFFLIVLTIIQTAMSVLSYQRQFG